MKQQEDLIVGGQAVIEGVMMRSPHAYAVAVRAPSGEIVHQGEQIPRLSERHPVLGWPVLRGAATLISSMALGIKALNFSATVAFVPKEKEEEKEDTANNGRRISSREPERRLAEKESKNSGGGTTLAAATSIVFALVINVLLFVALPLLLTNALFIAIGSHPAAAAPSSGSWFGSVVATVAPYLKPVRPTVTFNLIDGMIRMALFVAMVSSFSLMRDIRRVFEYHGAEHKVVYAYEKGCALSVENARLQPRQHPRCGTSFLMVVMLVAILLFSVVKFDSLLFNFAVRIALIPLIAGLSYEFIKVSATRQNQGLFWAVTRPGIWLQNITTQEPDDLQLEVAIFALERSLELEPQAEREMMPAAVAV